MKCVKRKGDGWRLRGRHGCEMTMPGQPPTVQKEVVQSQLLAEVKGRWAQSASVSPSPATVPLSSVPLPSTSPAVFITQTRNSGESGLEGAEWGLGMMWKHHRRPGVGWTKGAAGRCPFPSGLWEDRTLRPGWGCSVAFGFWGRQCKDEDRWIRSPTPLPTSVPGGLCLCGLKE